MTIDPKFHADLRRLFSFVKPGDASRDEWPNVTVGVRDKAFHISGEGYFLLEELTGVIVTPAVKGGGRSASDARDLLIAACSLSLREGEDTALAWLDAELAKQPRVWTVIRPIRAYLPSEHLVVGRSELHRGLPKVEGLEWDPIPREDFPSSTISTTVRAHDDEAAQVVAEQRFAETFGILQLADPRRIPILEAPVIVLADNGSYMVNPDPRIAIVLDVMADNKGFLTASVDALSRAAQKEEVDRTDWERRTLGAARWLSRALASPLPADALVSLLVSLEALFVKGQKETNKRDMLARRLTSVLCCLKGMDAIQQEKWIADLYAKRNQVVHEAGNAEDEVEIQKLSDLTFAAVRWAARHLDSAHRPQHRACIDFDDVFAPHTPRV